MHGLPNLVTLMEGKGRGRGYKGIQGWGDGVDCALGGTGGRGKGEDMTGLRGRWEGE